METNTTDSIKQAEKEKGESFALRIAEELKIGNEAGLLAFKLFWPCRECILAYLFGIYLNKKDKYKKLLEAIKDAKEKEELLWSLWEDLKKDMEASSYYFAKAQWDMIQIHLFAERAKPGMTTKEALQKLNAHKSSFTIKR